jgi:hypothetical protein
MRELADDPSSRKRFLRMMGGAGAASAQTQRRRRCRRGAISRSCSTP